MQKVTLDQSTFKALSAETRIKILKLLDKRQFTQSEIAKELKLSVPTVNEHINALLKSNLIEKEKTERKWKYFSLSDKGKRVLHPPAETMIWITLGLLVISAVGAALSFAKHLFFGQTAMAAPVKMLAEGARDAAPLAAPAAKASPMAAIVFLVIAVILLIVLIYLIKKR